MLYLYCVQIFHQQFSFQQLRLDYFMLSSPTRPPTLHQTLKKFAVLHLVQQVPHYCRIIITFLKSLLDKYFVQLYIIKSNR